MTGAESRKLLEEVLPGDVTWEAVERLGYQRRERKRDVLAPVRALVLMGGTTDAEFRRRCFWALPNRGRRMSSGARSMAGSTRAWRG